MTLDDHWQSLEELRAARLAARQAGDTALAAALDEQIYAGYLELTRGGTTPRGLPWPSPVDPLWEGADAIRALAEAVDAQTTAIYAAIAARPQTEARSVVVTPGPSGNLTIQFLRAFAAPPIVVATNGETAATADQWFPIIVTTALTASQFACAFVRHDGIPITSGSRRLNYIAMAAGATTRPAPAGDDGGPSPVDDPEPEAAP